MKCTGIAFIFALLWCEQPSPPAPVDSFCSVYESVIKDAGDAEIKAKLDVKKRLLANELIYRKQCKGGN